MPKMKTHSGAKKRFSLTAKGKVKYKRANMRHILTKHSSNVKRKLRKGGTMEANSADAKTIKKLLRKLT
jgi:large subunit ribosomal protein L35